MEARGPRQAAETIRTPVGAKSFHCFPSLTEQDIQTCLAYAADRDHERQVRVAHV